VTHPISIIGGNISGLSAAWHLAQKGCPVTVYETRLWDKPCGGGISIGFARHLSRLLNVDIPALNQSIPKIRCCFSSLRCIEIDPLFVIVSRYDLQKQLISRLTSEPNINIIFKKISPTELALLSPQTVLATGFSGFTRQIIQNHWHDREYALTLKTVGTFHTQPRQPAHLLFFDSRLKGYGWLFLKGNNQFNCGIGGLVDKKNLDARYDAFIDLLNNRFGYPLHPEKPPSIWKIPITMDLARAPVSFFRNNIEFIGAGDALGLAHPVMAAGIEPAWQSGWLIGESYDPGTGLINTERYRNLLKKNLKMTSRSPFNALVSRALRVPGLPLKDTVAYGLMKYFNQPIARHILNNPWFALMHDGHAGTEFRQHNDDLFK